MQASASSRLSLFFAIALLFAGGATAAESVSSTEMRAAPSAFLRAQATSPIHWQTWNEATLARARVSGKSIYVFIGSPLSELTRATINQTFTSEKTVAWLNENFFCIFVDADVQPDVAAYGQHFITTVKQLRGSPIHLWLTPELQPYDGSNYLSPSEEWGKPGFLRAARSALDAWAGDGARARTLATEAMSMMRPTPLSPNASVANLEARLDRAAAAWVETVDTAHGGFGSAPKQPEPELIRFLLRRGDTARAAALGAARALVTGAVRDPIDGGFYRRAIDAEWKEPQRQKVLADQARIALALLDAATIGNDASLRAAAFAALDFSLKHLREADGSFVSALDSTSAGDQVQPAPITRVGVANTGAQGWLIAALQRTGEKRFTAVATTLAAQLRGQLTASRGALPHILGIPGSATAADYAAVALAFRELKEDAVADDLLARANELFFDSASGSYLASPAKLPVGIALRVPITGDSPSPEAIALLAGADAKTAATLRRALLSTIEYDEQPPGEVLLALAQTDSKSIR
ncbi:MAG: DUF255 domain-containing protein [Opitutaceae bacterium]